MMNFGDGESQDTAPTSVVLLLGLDGVKIEIDRTHPMLLAAFPSSEGRSSLDKVCSRSGSAGERSALTTG